MDRYYPNMDKVMRSVFYDNFVNKKITFRVKDLYEIGLVYFISRFLQSELPRTFIKKADFALVESGHYLKYDWGEYDVQADMFRDVVFTNEEEVEFNLGAIHQDILGHEHHNDSDHSVFKEMIEYKKKVDSEFNGMREFVQESVKSAANTALQNKIIPEFILTDIKIEDKDWFRTLIHTGRPWNDEDTPQKEPQSNDCGMFVYAFDEYVSHDIFDISSKLFDVVNHRIRYGALLWDYARQKQSDGAISESEATGNVTSKHGGFKRSREQFGSTRIR
ncbi:hypothetical protein FXO38_03783 [Capsicum annuum]|nr:hypothetical protein FXO38_03783 [Capsicum annuum]